MGKGKAEGDDMRHDSLYDTVSSPIDRPRFDERGDDWYRALLETAPEAIITVDDDGLIVLVNAETEQLFGYARHHLLGHPDRAALAGLGSGPGSARSGPALGCRVGSSAECRPLAHRRAPGRQPVPS
jgi:hypothetical protein